MEHCASTIFVGPRCCQRLILQNGAQYSAFTILDGTGQTSQDSKADSSTWSVRTFWASFFWSPDNLTCEMARALSGFTACGVLATTAPRVDNIAATGYTHRANTGRERSGPAKQAPRGWGLPTPRHPSAPTMGRDRVPTTQRLHPSNRSGSTVADILGGKIGINSCHLGPTMGGTYKPRSDHNLNNARPTTTHSPQPGFNNTQPHQASSRYPAIGPGGPKPSRARLFQCQ